MTKTKITSVDCNASRAELSTDTNGYLLMSLEGMQVVRAFYAMAAEGKVPKIVERKLRVCGLSIPVYILIDGGE